MSMRPIYIDAHPEELFGDNYRETLGPKEARIIEESLEDGVINQADFDRYQKCEETDLDKLCYRGWLGDAHIDKQRSEDTYGYRYLRRTYYYLRKHSEQYDEKDYMSGAEVARFKRWFQAESAEAVSFDEYFGSGIYRNFFRNGMLFYWGDDAPKIDINSNVLLLVTHPSLEFDKKGATKAGIDKQVEDAKENDIPVVYLTRDSNSIDDMYLDDMNPTDYISSHMGEHSIRFNGDEVFLAGGNFGACFAGALKNLILNRSTKNPLIARICLDSVYAPRLKKMVKSKDGLGMNVITEVVTLGELLKKKEDPHRYIEEAIGSILPSLKGKKNIEYCYNGACRVVDQSDPTSSKITIIFE